MTPAGDPHKPGDVCWDVGYADRMLSPISQVGADAIDWFLATHSPITCTDGAGPVAERDLFEQLFASSKPETLLVVKGSQGTGKSQLINWLKLRFDDAIDQDESPGIGTFRLRNVLIRRRSGSLKDALQQLVAQLPEYGQFLDKIQAAIEGVSGDAANRRLYTEMHNSLFAARGAAPKRLRRLDEVFNDNGTVGWLCRGDGAIDRNVRRLTEQSDVEARESLPPFTAADFDFPATARVNFDEDLKLRLEDEEEVRRQCAEYANGFLRQAIAGLTGLRGHTLNEIFRAIRTEMRRRGEALALFVEDVSTLSVLDEELVNALQPQNDSTLCPLLGVMGMTEPAYTRLPDNLKERINRVVTLAQDSGFRAQEASEDATDRFVARYLNAMRAGAGRIRSLADDVRHHGEQRLSACADCPLKGGCFDAFGSVPFGESRVGLFPLSAGAARRLLHGQSNEAQLRTPRTLLQHVLLALLSRFAAGFQGPSIGLAIQARSPRDLGVEQDRMLAGWAADHRNRLSYLLYYWTGADTLQEGATALQPMLAWFGQPPFSKGTLPKGAPPPLPAPKPQPVAEAVPVASPKYDAAIRHLDEWYQQSAPLRGDNDFRALLLSVIQECLPLEEIRVPSEAIRRRSRDLKTSNVAIEGMVRMPAVSTKARFEFARSQETYDLLRDLVAFKELGGGSWKFPGGDEARRRLGAWLAKNASGLIQAYDVVKCDREAALRYGIRFLNLAYRFSQRKELPSEVSTAVELIVSFSPGSTVTYGHLAQEMLGDLPNRVREVRDVVLDELAVRQGGAGLNYIDPRMFIESLSVASDDMTLGDIDVEATLSDYPVIGQLAKTGWARLKDVLEGEHTELQQRVRTLEPVLRHWGIATDPLPMGVEQYLKSAREVIKVSEAANHSIGDPSLQAQIRDLTPKNVGQHFAALDAAVKTLAQGPVAVLSLDFSDLDRTVDFISRADKAIRNLEERLTPTLADVVTEGDVESDRTRAVGALKDLAALDASSASPREADA